MKNFIFISLIATTIVLNGCTIAETESDTIEKRVTDDPISDDDSTANREPDMDTVEKQNAMQLRSEISDYRMRIENTSNQLERKELDLSQARANISQDWNRLEYFVSDDEVVKIKTYPSEEGKSKTEEFYFLDKELVFAMIEEADDNAQTMEGEASGKAFYYANGELIVSEDYEITQATEEEKNNLEQGTKLQNEAITYLNLIYESLDE
jgi:hypothetical protein